MLVRKINARGRLAYERKKDESPNFSISLLTAGMLFCNGTSVQAELNFGELGSENNQIAAPAAGITASPEAVALDDLGISIVPGSYISIEQTDGFMYVYTQESGTIPYVIVGYYNITAEDFTNQFTQYMAQEYSDLQVTSQESMITLNDREFSGIVYSYNVGGYVVQDTRLFLLKMETPICLVQKGDTRAILLCGKYVGGNSRKLCLSCWWRQ
ncbi:MAG: hypothetical protein ACLU9T_02175 [Blautia faecis]